MRRLRVTPPQAVPQAEPGIRHPVENISGAADATQLASPLPQLDDSDALAKDAIATIQNGDTWIRLLVPDGIVRHIVATVDGLPHKTLALQVLPIRSASGTMLTIGERGRDGDRRRQCRPVRRVRRAPPRRSTPAG